MRVALLLTLAALSGVLAKKYNTSGGPVANKLNVHIVPHTCVGWAGRVGDLGRFELSVVGASGIAARAAVCPPPLCESDVIVVVCPLPSLRRHDDVGELAVASAVAALCVSVPLPPPPSRPQAG